MKNTNCQRLHISINFNFVEKIHSQRQLWRENGTRGQNPVWYPSNPVLEYLWCDEDMF